MFSISAINDTDSRNQWEPLAPTKEAQEFHLTKTYHDGLLKLQAKEYEKAHELLESVLKDHLIASAQVDGEAGDNHLLQLRFLALKNLATVCLQWGSAHYEGALHCYLQAVEIDTKDSVVWNQLGTLSCSMGLLNISRWAFEQGLVCSPNNWNCMEKLLEVLIAIRDEVACLSVAELILRHWPSHARALHVKLTIEESESVPYAPKGIDKLEPKHVRLKFIDKRKAGGEDLDEDVKVKRSNQNIDVHLVEVSWVGLVDALLDILLPLSGCGSEVEVEKALRSGDVRLRICLAPSSDRSSAFMGRKGLASTSICDNTSLADSNTESSSSFKEKEARGLGEHPQERRSTRLERLRSRKPGKEELDYSTSKDLARVVTQYLEPFISSALGTKDTDHEIRNSVSYPDGENSQGSDCNDVHSFLVETSCNYGAYHVSHMLLEKLSSTYPPHHDAFFKFLDLEKLTRHWGKDRSPECNLFLAELYFDFGSSSSDTTKQSEFISEASYHLCKIIELVALENSDNCFSSLQGSSRISSENSSNQHLFVENSLITNNKSFWVRFFWLSGQLSLRDGNKAKACEEFCISLSLLEKMNDVNDSLLQVCLPHCRVLKRLTLDRILYEINVLKVDLLMKNVVPEMFEKEMYEECIALLSPLLFSVQEVDLDALSLQLLGRKDAEITSVELAAIDILIRSCEKENHLDVEILLNSHQRKLQILMAAAGMHEYFTSNKSFREKSEAKAFSDIETKDSPSSHLNHLVAEVKAISQFISQVKNVVEHSGDFNDIQMTRICDMQFLLLSVMCNVINTILSKKSSGAAVDDQVERCCLVDAAIAFCKLQHLDLSVPVKSHVELIVATHDLLAEYGLCCWGEGEGEEGKFLKFSIKHLLALDMKLKLNSSVNEKKIECDDMEWDNCQAKASPDRSKLNAQDLGLSQNDETGSMVKDAGEDITREGMSTHKSILKDATEGEFIKQGSEESAGKFNACEKNSDELVECENEQNEDEKEELELKIENTLDQCFFCLYGLNLRCDSSYDDDLSVHKNTSRGDYQTKEQCADVFQYILPYAKASSRTGLVKLRRVLRAIRKHFLKPPENVLDGNVVDKFLDDPNLCEEKLSDEAGSDEFLVTITKILLNDVGSIKQYRTSVLGSSEPYLEVYSNLYYFLAQSEEMSATDKWPGFVLTKEGEEFVQHNANLFKYDLLYNPLRYESWQKLAHIYDEEVDLLLNDGSKHINVAGWRKNDSLPHRVEISRRRSRRCLLMSLALAKSPTQQREIHELLALVYYDSLQNVVPFYDQWSVVPPKDEAWLRFCENSLKHFKKAFAHQQDWSHAFYMGKLSEKLGLSHDKALSYYAKAIALNPSAVDSIYRMHASRLKFLGKSGKGDLQACKDLSTYAFNQSTRDAVMEISSKFGPKTSDLPTDMDGHEAYSEDIKHDEFLKEEKAWHMLYNDCLSGLETCVEGDLKHYHKARYTLARGLYRRGENGDVDKAKDELSFCFKSSRSSFTINMWEIDSMVKKGRRKTPGLSGNRKALEVNLPESSRKFITCIRKYLLFYLKLLEETGDICTLERAYISLRADKRFAICIEDLVPVALGRYVKVLITSIRQVGIASSGDASGYEHILEKMFSLFMEQGNLWPELCSLPEIQGPDMSESNLFGYLHDYIITLERNVKVENLEAINERIRKRFKNPKLSNINIAKVCRHASTAWCRSLIISLALITSVPSESSTESQTSSSLTGGLESNQLLCVDLQINELWSSTFEDSTHLKSLEPKWCPILSKINNIFVKRAAEVNWETAHSLLRSSYNFFRESSCMLPSGLNLYLVPYRLATGVNVHQRMDGVEILDFSMPRKLLLWAYTLVHGHFANISSVVKHCEEHLKSKLKKGAGILPTQSHANLPAVISSPTGIGRDGSNHSGETDAEASPATPITSTSLSENQTMSSSIPLLSSGDTRKSSFHGPQFQQCSNIIAERMPNGGESDKG
ncbi:calcineurin-binding protein 1-like [Benincasa hispida]|uniref:calcineurin-binding protein 1-like n=1 Tax=Benincasa hispida TaxID=102211 RepID=UPI001900A9E0|nr:calcineurin-binding protein 1-like [Benincasa hispida]